MLVNVVLVFEPNVWMLTRHTIMISANITAYSTAVGPSSETKNRLIAANDMEMLLSRIISGDSAR
jgi:hypothetical protein